MGQATMVSYLERKKNKPIVYVDTREASNRNGKKIVQEMELLGAEVTTCKLDFGDYMVGNDVAIERKTVFDLVNTLTQRFLFDQIFKMREVYPKALVIIEGYMGVLRKFRRVTPEALNGAFFVLAQKGVPLVPTVDYKDTAVFLIVASKQLMKEAKGRVTIRHRAKTETVTEQQLFLMTGLPHVGPVLGRNLLQYFGTPRRVFCASREELMDVKEIGPKIAESITATLNTPYIPEAE